MLSVGQRNTLRILRESSLGFHLDGGKLGEILLPGRYIPKRAGPGDDLDVFIYLDSEDRLVATTETPHAMVGDFAFLKVVSALPQMGAFLDWGLGKDLFLPIREQAHRVRTGEWVVVFIRVDSQSGRIVATTRLERHLNAVESQYSEGQAVRLLIASETELGYKAIVENTHWGLLYRTDFCGPLAIGRRLNGYVRAIRPDGKIDLSLDQAGYQRVAPLTRQILDALEAAGGRLEFDDQSAPEAIRATFGMSKKAFKQALGSLYRERRIDFANRGIQLVW